VKNDNFNWFKPVEIIKKLIQHGADVNFYGWNDEDGVYYSTPLFAAVRNELVDVVRMLLESGARKNLRPLGYRQYISGGRTISSYFKSNEMRAVWDSFPQDDEEIRDYVPSDTSNENEDFHNPSDEDQEFDED
jgi:ankyrin repeat protein